MNLLIRSNETNIPGCVLDGGTGSVRGPVGAVVLHVHVWQSKYCSIFIPPVKTNITPHEILLTQRYEHTQNLI